MARSGRRPGDSGARDAIVDAARTTFARAGYDGGSIRAIAAAAGVDPALVHHYFGSKQRLFASAMELPFDPELVRTTVLSGPRDELGVRIAATFLTIWDDEVTQPVLLGVMRSAATDPIAAAMVRRTIVDEIVAPLVAELGVSQPALRAQLGVSQLLGIAFARYILGAESLAGASVAEIAAIVGPTLQGYLLGPLPGQERAANGPEAQVSGPAAQVSGHGPAVSGHASEASSAG